MKCIYTADDPILVGYLRSVLNGRGIGCVIRNELLQSGAGELPPNECWPELWVLDDRDVAVARRLIGSVLEARADGGEPWRCSVCGEQSEPQFAACWRCGADRR